MPEYTLKCSTGHKRIGIAAAQFNQFITDQLLRGAKDALIRNDVAEHEIVTAWVPGAFELPLAARALLSSGNCDAVIALGAVIRGETPHFDYVAGTCAAELSRLSVSSGCPVTFGVLTTDTVEQAMERADMDRGNKGFDCGMAALHMLGLIQRLKDGPGA